MIAGENSFSTIRNLSLKCEAKKSKYESCNKSGGECLGGDEALISTSGGAAPNIRAADLIHCTCTQCSLRALTVYSAGAQCSLCPPGALHIGNLVHCTVHSAV